jgi:hypothetical protein
MNVAILQGIVFVAVAVVGLAAWHKYAERDYLWLSLIGMAGVLLKAWDYATITMLHLPVLVMVVASSISLGVWIVLILLVLKIVLRK